MHCPGIDSGREWLSLERMAVNTCRSWGLQECMLGRRGGCGCLQPAALELHTPAASGHGSHQA